MRNTGTHPLEEVQYLPVTRTRRLFYVCCSRAEKGLAVVYFVENPDNAIAHVRARVLHERSDFYFSANRELNVD